MKTQVNEIIRQKLLNNDKNLIPADPVKIELIEMSLMEKLKDNFAYRQIRTGGRFAGLKMFFKKLIRKMTRFYVEPISNQQTSFNNAVYRSFGSVEAELSELKKENEELRRQLAELYSAMKNGNNEKGEEQ